MFLGIVWYMVDGSGLRRHEEVKILMNRCFDDRGQTRLFQQQQQDGSDRNQ
jgi:hypothetical protein